MNRKQFLVLLLVLIVLGGAGLAVFWQDIAEYRASGQKIGGRLFPSLKVADVAQIELKDAKAQSTLQRKENGWFVQERRNYPADFKGISDLIIKLIDVKVLQDEPIGQSLLPRVNLLEPAQGKNEGT